VVTGASLPETSLAIALPRAVFEQFSSSFYEGCVEPPFDQIKVSRVWSGEEGDRISFVPPGGSYFLVLVGAPSGPEWSFNSFLQDPRGGKRDALRIDSSVPDGLTDTQLGCTRGPGVPVADVLHVESLALSWTVYLVAPSGRDFLPTPVAGAMTGYYGTCPAIPPIEDLKSMELGTDEASDVLEFRATPPTTSWE